MSFNIKTPQEIKYELSQRFKETRLTKKLTREGLASRSGVSSSSLKRFETTGNISLESLLKLALVLECLEDFEKIAQTNMHPLTFDEILHEKSIPKKGTIK